MDTFPQVAVEVVEVLRAEQNDWGDRNDAEGDGGGGGNGLPAGMVVAVMVEDLLEVRKMVDRVDLERMTLRQKAVMAVMAVPTVRTVKIYGGRNKRKEMEDGGEGGKLLKHTNT